MSTGSVLMLLILKSRGKTESAVALFDEGIGNGEGFSSLTKLSKSPFVNSSSASSLSDDVSCSVRRRFLATFPLFIGFALFFKDATSFFSFDTDDTIR